MSYVLCSYWNIRILRNLRILGIFGTNRLAMSGDNEVGYKYCSEMLRHPAESSKSSSTVLNMPHLWFDIGWCSLSSGLELDLYRRAVGRSGYLPQENPFGPPLMVENTHQVWVRSKK